MLRNPAANDKVTQALLGEDAGHEDKAENHRQQQVEQVVSRVERSDPHREGQQQEPHALRRQAQGPVAVEPAEKLADAFEPHAGYSGTGTDSTTSWMTRSASSERSEEHTSELQSPCNLVCRLLLEKKKKRHDRTIPQRWR